MIVSMSIGSRIVFGIKDTDWLDLLWEAVLQVTILGLSMQWAKGNLAGKVWSNQIVGECPLWLVRRVIRKDSHGPRRRQGQGWGGLGIVLQNGTSYNVAMHKAALSLGTLFPSPGLEAPLQHLELESGREVVNNEYSKLSKLIAVTKQSTVQSPDSMSTMADKVSWLVEMLSDMGWKGKLPSRVEVLACATIM